MKNVKYSFYLNKVRINLAANLGRSPLIKEPLNKSYGDHWLSARFGIKARLRRHAVACQEVATPSRDCAESPAGRVLKHASAALQSSPRTKALSFALRLASTCFRTLRGPIGLAQRFLNQGGSIKIGSQIYPGFVQVETSFFVLNDLLAWIFGISD